MHDILTREPDTYGLYRKSFESASSGYHFQLYFNQVMSTVMKPLHLFITLNPFLKIFCGNANNLVITYKERKYIFFDITHLKFGRYNES